MWRFIRVKYHVRHQQTYMRRGQWQVVERVSVFWGLVPLWGEVVGVFDTADQACYEANAKQKGMDETYG